MAFLVISTSNFNPIVDFASVGEGGRTDDFKPIHIRFIQVAILGSMVYVFFSELGVLALYQIIRVVG